LSFFALALSLAIRDGSAILEVRDDGVGFDPNAISLRPEGRGHGLLGIRERLNAVGGSVQINSAPGRGTELEISVPLEV